MGSRDGAKHWHTHYREVEVDCVHVGSRDSAVVRALDHLPPMWLGFNSQILSHIWVKFVVGTRPCSERFFSRYSGFPLSPKNQRFQIPIQSQYPQLVPWAKALTLK